MNPMKTIAIVSALKEELEYLYNKKEMSWSYRCDHDNELQVAECDVNGCKIIATNASGKMGLTEAAILTTRVILGYTPELVAMIGVCGGFKTRGVNIGDVIVAEKSFHYQFGSYENGDIQRELKVCEVDSWYYSKLLNFLDSIKMATIQTNSPKGMITSDRVLKMHSGPMASADLVVKDKDKLEEAKSAERKVIAVDMESYAFLRASNLLGVKSIVIKSASDFADAKKGCDDGLREYAKYTATEALLQFLFHEIGSADKNISPTYLPTLNELDKENNISKASSNRKYQKENSLEISTNNDAPISSLNKIMTDMILIPAGKLMVGDEETGLQELDINSFFMGKFPVTQKLYSEIMEYNPSEFKGEDLPVENVTWFDAIEFCNKLSHRCGLEPVYQVVGEDVTIAYVANGFRLPTEAEWEYAACPEQFPEKDIAKYAWYNSNAYSSTQRVGQKLANPIGLYDLSGNVWEWCNDWYHPDGTKIVMGGPSTGEDRVRRGGSWANFVNNLNPKYRNFSNPSFSDNHIGFRIVKKLK